jgi:hypothetical protein
LLTGDVLVIEEDVLLFAVVLINCALLKGDVLVHFMKKEDQCTFCVVPS